jgi:hypothetical protein
MGSLEELLFGIGTDLTMKGFEDSLSRVGVVY